MELGQGRAGRRSSVGGLLTAARQKTCFKKTNSDITATRRGKKIEISIVVNIPLLALQAIFFVTMSTCIC